jgi:hypothetical protein
MVRPEMANQYCVGAEKHTKVSPDQGFADPDTPPLITLPRHPLNMKIDFIVFKKKREARGFFGL